MLLTLAVSLVACQALGIQSSVGNGVASGTAGSSAMTSPAASIGARRSPTAAAQTETGTAPPPAATNAAAAEAAETVKAYLDALIGGRYAAAWQLVARSSQVFWGTQQEFAAERSAFYASAGPTVQVSEPDHTTETLTAWIPSGFDGDRRRAYVVNVNHPRIASNAAREVLIAAPDSSGAWRIWIAR